MMLATLRDKFMSTEVVKVRVGYFCSTANGNVLDACFELKRRGLAEWICYGSPSKPRWRRSMMAP